VIYAIDANILVYAYNIDSPLNPRASTFLEQEVLTGNIRGCLAYQSLYEFYAIITDPGRVEKNVALEKAKEILKTYMKARSNLRNVLDLISRYKITKQEIFDAVFVATLLDNGVDGIITRNTKHFDRFEFLTVLNPFS